MKIISQFRTDKLLHKLANQQQFQVEALDTGTDCFANCCDCCGGTGPCDTCLDATDRLGGNYDCAETYSPGVGIDYGSETCMITSGKPLWGHHDSGFTPCDGLERTHLDKSHCHRLFVWECISNNGTGFDNATDPIILVTNSSAGTEPYKSGPFYDGFTIDPGIHGPGYPSGTLLDMQPYWWEGCNVGGWALGSAWWTPPLSEIYDCLDLAGDLPAVGVDFTLIVLVRFKHYHNSSGPYDSMGPPFWPSPGPYNETDGYGKVKTIWLNCCDSKETVICDACEEAIPKYITANLIGTGCMDGSYTLEYLSDCSWTTTIPFTIGDTEDELYILYSIIYVGPDIFGYGYAEFLGASLGAYFEFENYTSVVPPVNCTETYVLHNLIGFNHVDNGDFCDPDPTQYMEVNW